MSIKPISLTSFKNNLISYYENSEEQDIDTRIEALARIANMQNKENYPLFFAVFLNTIITKEIKLSELVSNNGEIRIAEINKLVMEVKTNVINKNDSANIDKNQVQDKYIAQELEIINKLKNIDYTKPITAETAKLIAEHHEQWLENVSDTDRRLYTSQMMQTLFPERRR